MGDEKLAGEYGLGPCAGCGHDPACGFSSVYSGGVERWYCHDDDHSCYVTATVTEHYSRAENLFVADNGTPTRVVAGDYLRIDLP